MKIFQNPDRLVFTSSTTPVNAGAPSTLQGTSGVSRQDAPHSLSQLEAWRTNEEAAGALTVRWALSDMPLQISIAPNPTFPGLEAELMRAARQWEVASQGLIRFREAGLPQDQHENAHIRILWSNQTTLGRDYEVGHTLRTVQGKRITHAEIILIQVPLIDRHLNPAQQHQRLLTTMLHEMGHALGLEHSELKTDVMYYRGWQNAILSANDIQRLQALYAQGSMLA
jgi:hypothetical protein